ncbi:MAG: MATE family efflux transporter [Spirochaetaceae bacterium]
MIKKLKQAANRDFFMRIFSITIPVTLQNLLGASRNLVDTIMIGTLGVAQIAAVGAAGKPFFVFLILLFGLTNGSGILVSQYWGKKDGEGVARFVILSATLTLSVSIIIAILIKIFTTQIIGLTTSDPEIIKYGSEYLRIISTNLILQSIILSMNVGLRSTGQVKKCTFVSLIGVSSNIFLNYTLIFGHFGFDAMGLKGAAYGTFFSCLLEAILILSISLFFNRSFRLSVSKFKEKICIEDVRKLLKLALPLSINSFAWAAGTYVYFIIYGRMGSDELAIMTMIEPLTSIMISFFTGLATGSGILLGHSLGEEKFDKVWQEAKLILIIGIILSIAVFIMMLNIKNIYLGFFTSMPEHTLNLAKIVCNYVILRVLFLAVNIVIIVGILRSGGDTKFVLILDMCCQWLVGIPLAVLGAFVLKLSLPWVAILVISEDLVKIIVVIKRMKGKKWIRNLIS